MMAYLSERTIHGCTFKYFRCDFCGKARPDYDITEVAGRHYCRYPDHSPRLRICWRSGRLRIWLRPWLPRSYWGC
jgi:hypothetical protein